MERLAAGPLVLDTRARTVSVSSREIALTAKEYALLEYLMSNAGRVLSRNMIIEHVWDQSFDGITNIVDVYIRRLRRKLDEPFGRSSLGTVRGVGYRLRADQ